VTRRDENENAMRLMLPLAVVLVVSTPARASDGALEIHKDCVATGCFPGDDPGFPVTATTAGGAYVLTSNLVVPTASTTAITLGTGASLDLGGFSITGPTVCGGVPTTCTGTGSGRGIDAGAQSSVRNGRIAGMGISGVAASEAVRLSDLTIAGNGGSGVRGTSMRIERCVIERNGVHGISIENTPVGGSVIQGNLVRQNGQDGINVVQQALVKDNVVVQNGDFGFEGTAALSGNVFINNQSQISGGFGIGENLCNASLCP
jgi:hypothetical protein